MQPLSLILIGGFLGAGKTTLVAAATERLVRQGKRVGLITNDQAANLVDTEILKAAGSPVQEVAGGCFCCRFDELLGAMDRLIEAGNPDVLIGEPVGSCTDLSATVLQPMKDLRRNGIMVAPFSVLVDVKQVRTLQRLRKLLEGADAARFPDNVMYIYQKQLEEADLIVLNKADLVSPEELADVENALRREFTSAPVLTISAQTGQGIDAWLDRVLHDGVAGRKIVEVDYDEYADGEAALGWLNASVRLQAGSPADWRQFCLDLIAGLQNDFRTRSAEIAHLKLYLSTGDGSLAANLTGNDRERSIRGEATPSREARLILNARAHIGPDDLRALVEQRLAGAPGGVRAAIEDLQSFAPSRPEPKHRYEQVV